MAQDKNFPRMIPADIDQPAPDAYALPPHVRVIPLSSLIGAANAQKLADPESMRAQQHLQRPSDSRLALHAFAISLRLGAQAVGNVIRGCWNLITSIRPKKAKASPDLSPKPIHGLRKFSDVRFGNVVYFAPTAIESILLNNRITTAIQTYEERCRNYMTLTKSAEEYETIKDGLLDGSLDPESISFADWLHVSFLSLYSKSEELHTEPKLVYKGSVYHLHVCVQGVVPAQPVDLLRQKV